MHTPALNMILRRRIVGICVVVAATLALAPLTGGTALAAPKSHHCMTPAGTDANKVFGVTQQLVVYGAPPESGCASVSTGESWTPLAGAFWVTNTTFESVPLGYEPSAATPMEDFLSKAKTITYVIDAGTKRERTYPYRVRDVVKVDTVDEFFPPGLWPQPYPIAQFIAKIPPLPAGQHTWSAELRMSAMSCDGLGNDTGSSCIGPGAISLCTGIPFTVTPREAGDRR